MIGLCGGQLRVSGKSVIGFDMTAVLGIAAQFGLSGPLVVEFLAICEAQMVRAFNKAARDAEGAGE